MSILNKIGLRRIRFGKIIVGEFGRAASARCAFDETHLHEIWFVDSLYRVHFFGDCGGEGGKTDWPARKIINNRTKDFFVDGVKTVCIDIQHIEGGLGDFSIYFACMFHFGEVADTTQKTIGDTWRAARANGNCSGGFLIEGGIQNARISQNNFLNIFVFVIIEMENMSEAVAEWS